MTDFDLALKFVLSQEGGYVNDPDDPGGRTDRGISARAHPEAWADGRISDLEVEQVYKTYWQGADCELMPWPLSLALFDFAVNSGVHRARSYLMLDGEPLERALRLIAGRVIFLRGLVETDPKKGKFLNGWLNRCAALASACIRGVK